MKRLALIAVAASLFLRVAAGSGSVDAAAPILGSGSTFAEVALDAWAGDLYAETGFTVTYTGTGSLGGLGNFQQGIVDFASSDVPYDTPAQARAYAYTPIVAGGTALMYNLVDPAGNRIENLRLTPETIANIFFTNITNWRDPAILAENPALMDRMPNWEIRLAVRQPGSGTTGVFTDFLSSLANAEWEAFITKTGAITFANRNYVTDWPADIPGVWFCRCSRLAGSAEIANYVAQTTPGSQGAIGYAEAAYAQQLGLPVVRIRNAAGFYRLPDARSVAVALLEATENGDGTQNLEQVHTNPREEAYPASSYNYLILPTASDFPAEQGRDAQRVPRVQRDPRPRRSGRHRLLATAAQPRPVRAQPGEPHQRAHRGAAAGRLGPGVRAPGARRTAGGR